MITLADIEKARILIRNIIKETPILTSEQLNALTGATVYLKCEHLQKTGSFKIRGATNRVQHAKKEGANYITAASSGNHGQAVAFIANKLGLPATIVVPTDASASKVAAIKAYGVKVETCGTTSEERIPRAKEIAREMGGVFIPPYDHPHIMAGQGTAGLEILEQVRDLDMVIVPVGGGGLISGILTAIKETNPRIKVIGVEPEDGNDTFLSLKKGKRTLVETSTQTIADGLRTAIPGELTFPIIQKYLDDLVLVSDEEIRFAMRFVLERMKQLIEPSSATTIAAAIFEKVEVKGKNVVCLISGRNVDLMNLDHMLKSTK
ncbi:threonine ammonia-lyase [Bacillaceae bacterium W0354]